MAPGLSGRAEARVDLGRIAANFRAVAALAGRPLMPVVKADAYGHGAARLGPLFEALGAPLLGVAYPDEGAELRSAGVRVPIVVFAGGVPGDEDVLLRHDLTPVVSGDVSLECAARAAARRPGLAVHLKVDTGMSRLGFTPEELRSAAARLVAAGAAIDGLMTQLAAADQDPHATERQLDAFDRALADLAGQGHRPRWVHAANSAGLAFSRPSHSLARPGLLLYGLQPRPLAPPIEVQPAMSVVARVLQVKEIAAGTAVSYGGRFVAPSPTRIATVGLGYADGVPRTDAMRTTGVFVLGGVARRVVGTVCMDFTMLDVTAGPPVSAGDEAVFLGDQPTAWDVGVAAGTNPWQALTAIGPRVPRVYSGDDAP